jgi:hypothetical protein
MAKGRIFAMEKDNGFEIAGVPMYGGRFWQGPEAPRFAGREESMAALTDRLGVPFAQVASREEAGRLFLDALRVGGVLPKSVVLEDMCRNPAAKALSRHRGRYVTLAPLSSETPESLRSDLLSDIMELVTGEGCVRDQWGDAVCEDEICERLICKKCRHGTGTPHYERLGGYDLCPDCAERVKAYLADVSEKPFCGMCAGIRATVAYFSFCVYASAFDLPDDLRGGDGQNLMRFFGACMSLIRFGFSSSGRHSSEAGRLKGEGEVFAGYGFKRKAVRDASSLYGLVRFDGEEWLSVSDPRHKAPAANFEFGAIFEIGRLIMEKGISFAEGRDDALRTDISRMRAREHLSRMCSRILSKSREKQYPDNVFAEAIGVSPYRLALWKKGAGDMTVGTLFRIADVLLVPAYELLSEKET